jgi:hypothetical protein
LNTRPLKIGLKVMLRAAPAAHGTVVDYELSDPEGHERAFPYLIEWDDDSTTWHRWFELEAVEPEAQA